MNNDISSIMEKYLEVLTEAKSNFRTMGKQTAPDYLASKQSAGFRQVSKGSAGSNKESNSTNAGKGHLTPTEEVVSAKNASHFDKINKDFSEGRYLQLVGDESILNPKDKRILQLALSKNELGNLSDIKQAPEGSLSYWGVPLAVNTLNGLKDPKYKGIFKSLLNVLAKNWDRFYSNSKPILDARTGRAEQTELTDPKVKEYYLNKINKVLSTGYFDVSKDKENAKNTKQFDITGNTKLVPENQYIGTFRVDSNGEVSERAYLSPQEKKKLEPYKDTAPKVKIANGGKQSAMSNSTPSESQKDLTSSNSDALRELQKLQELLKTSTGGQKWAISTKISDLKKKLGN